MQSKAASECLCVDTLACVHGVAMHAWGSLYCAATCEVEPVLKKQLVMSALQ